MDYFIPWYNNLISTRMCMPQLAMIENCITSAARDAAQRPQREQRRDLPHHKSAFKSKKKKPYYFFFLL